MNSLNSLSKCDWKSVFTAFARLLFYGGGSVSTAIFNKAINMRNDIKEFVATVIVEKKIVH